MRALFPPALASLALAACTTPFPPGSEADTSAAAQGTAATLLAQSVRAHGGDPYREGRTLVADFDGEWGTLAKRVQPDLVDAGFRKASREVYDLPAATVTQVHRGPEGEKTVVRTAGDVEVRRNGVPDTARVSLETAALVADAYRMFLTSPAYLRDRAPALSLMPDAPLNGRSHHRVRAVLEPGFGFSERDELIYWIDTQTFLLKRVSFTIEGFGPTRGTHVAVDFLEHARYRGTLFPSRYKETVLSPLKIVAHEWELEGLEIE